MTPSSSASLDVVYVRPSFGGILDYSEAILRVLRSEYPAARVEVLTVRSGPSPWTEGRRLAREIESRPGIVCADLGAGDRTIFWALHHLAGDRDVVLTVHDPGVFVNHLFQLPYAAGGPAVPHALAFHAGRAIDALVGQPLLRRVLRRARARLVLNESVRTLWGSELTYLPQPVYSPRVLSHAMPSPPCVAFAGYWGAAKGLDDLLDAYQALLPRHPGARFVIAGEGTSPEDRWASEFRTRARRVSERIEMPGFIAPADFDGFLRGLTALVLPYRTEIPGAASAMLMRAQQAGVPLVVSDTAFLRTQVAPENVTIVPPRDARALAEAIGAHLLDPGRFQARAEREQARVYAGHGDAEVGRRLRSIIDVVADELPATNV